MSQEKSFRIIINTKYALEPLLSVEKDDITPLFAKGKGLYICNYPEQAWYDHHHFTRNKNYSIEKKNKFFQLMNPGSILLSPTQDDDISKPTFSFYQQNIHHFGSSFFGKVAQISMAIQIISWIFKNRKSFDYCLIYNFYPAEIFIASFCRYLLNMHIIVDFEDDYLQQSTRKLYKQYFNIVKRIPNEIICITNHLKAYFPNRTTYVFNGFIDLSYTLSLDFNLLNGTRFLYSGALDEIRGVDLIPQIIQVLRNKIKDFTIFITGSGPLEQEVKNWQFEEVKFLGFLNSIEYEKILGESDIYLVLQKPDHPFSLGSFPSKIEFYSKYKKPIYRLVLNENKNNR